MGKPAHAEPRERTADNTVPFPTQNQKPDTGTQQTSSLEDLEASIRQILSSNGTIFPKAHVDWINLELKNHPNEDRLNEIIQHMQSVINEPEPSTSAETDVVPEADEEIIF